jgi:hypothetical protein
MAFALTPGFANTPSVGYAGKPRRRGPCLSMRGGMKAGLTSLGTRGLACRHEHVWLRLRRCDTAIIRRRFEREEACRERGYWRREAL